MNERIKEIAKQALPNVKYWDEEFILGTPGITPPDTRATNLNELTKFAELIVRDCASIANENLKLGAPYCGLMIEKHFGVEP